MRRKKLKTGFTFFLRHPVAVKYDTYIESCMTVSGKKQDKSTVNVTMKVMTKYRGLFFIIKAFNLVTNSNLNESCMIQGMN